MGAAELFDELVQGGWPRVLEWVAAHREESLNLDFKGRQPNAPHDQLQQEDRDVLGKATSGFANVDGGVLVVGLNTNDRSKGDPNTLAQAQTYLPDAVALQRAVQRHLKDLVLPHVAGLDVRAITEPGAPRGVVAILVPLSKARPHRTASSLSAKVNNRYFMRTDTDTVPMPHEMLGALFGSVPAPRLRLTAKWVGQRKVEGVAKPANRNPEVHIFLRNDGPGTAHQPLMVLDAIEGQNLSYGGNAVTTSTSVQRRVAFRPEPPGDQILYPGLETMVAKLYVGRTLDGQDRRLRLRGAVFAVDTAPTQFDESKTFTLNEVVTLTPDA